jgi:hypothetical protein
MSRSDQRSVNGPRSSWRAAPEDGYLHAALESTNVDAIGAVGAAIAPLYGDYPTTDWLVAVTRPRSLELAAVSLLRRSR